MEKRGREAIRGFLTRVLPGVPSWKPKNYAALTMKRFNITTSTFEVTCWESVCPSVVSSIENVVGAVGSVGSAVETGDTRTRAR